MNIVLQCCLMQMNSILDWKHLYWDIVYVMLIHLGEEYFVIS